VWSGCSVDDCLGPFGQSGDISVAGDWHGLGYTTLGVFRPSTGQWFLDNGNGVWDGCGVEKCFGPFGQSGDQAVVGDWGSLGRAAIGVFRPSTGQWWLDANANGKWDDTVKDRRVGPFGGTGDQAVAGDWDGRGRARIGIFRPSNGLWFLDNGNGVWNGCLVERCVGPFGLGGPPPDKPVVGAW
jgi:hypothetical protein